MAETSTSPVLSRIRDGIRTRRHDRRAGDQLRSQLAHYDGSADCLELVAIMRRHTAAEAAELRAVLDRRLFQS
jgi:hypothetical protein